MLQKQSYSTKREILLNLPLFDLAKRFNTDANLLYPYNSRQIYFYKKEIHLRSPIFFEIVEITFDDSPAKFYHAKITQLGASINKDIHIYDTFESYIDARTWLLSQAISSN